MILADTTVLRTCDAGLLQSGSDFMTTSMALMLIYRAMAIAVAAIMLIFITRRPDWREKLFAAMVFVPFVLRGLGIK